jgi:hypothetical protein
MKFHGEANLQQNYLRDAVIPLYTAFPASPVAGQLTFKDRILYICVEIVSGNPVWVPLTNEITAYTHIQSSSSATWTINHTLNSAHLNVQVYDDSGYMFMPNNIVTTSATQVVVYFNAATTGKAVLVTGHFEGQTKPTYSYEFLQTSPSDSWVITHGLGYNPIVRIFSGNQEIQPATITFNSLNQLTVTFATAIVGEAKLI